MSQSRLESRGMTLIELCMAVALVGILLLMTTFSLRQPINRAGPRVVADQTAEFLRRARNRAQTETTPVGVIFPNNGGSAVCCQSVAERVGQSNPRVQRIKDFASENPDTVLFVGTYGASGTWSKTPPSVGGSLSWVQDVPNYPDSARLIEWVGTETNPMIIFLPDGSAISNDLPSLDGAFRVVVSQGVSATGGTAGGTGVLATAPPVNRLTEACNPHTITVEATGDVRVNAGLEGGDGSTGISTAPLALGSPAPPVAINNPTSIDPQITAFQVAPNAGYLEGVFGFEQIISQNRQLTIGVVAKQSNDEELFCQVEEAGGKGQFSSPGLKKMRYQPAAPPFFEATWWSTWQWAPPPTSIPGDTFNLTATVTAARGGTDTTAGDATYSCDVYMIDLGRIFFGGKNAWTGRSEIYCVRADGTDLNRVTTQESLTTGQSAPAASRDGNKLLYQSVDSVTLVASLYGQSRRGGVATLITDKGVLPSLSDDGTVTVFQEFILFSEPVLCTVNPDQLFWPPIYQEVFNPDPAHPINNSSVGVRSGAVSEPIPWTVPGRTVGAPPDYSPDPDNRRVKLPRRIAFEANYGLSGATDVAIYTADFHDPGKSIEPHNLIRQTQGTLGGDLVTPGGDLRPVFHPNGKNILFWSSRGGRYSCYSVAFNENPAAQVSESNDGAVDLTPGFNNARDPYYSPDGTRIVFASDDHGAGNWDLYLLDLDPATNYRTVLPGATPIRLNLTSYSIFTNLFEDINRPVWTL